MRRWVDRGRVAPRLESAIIESPSLTQVLRFVEASFRDFD
jgi:hypothetical protein